ncbi:VOC family protein [Kordia jejudonensis]|uniref:VOC family protein n=1 Tax=Kordia jejudonensis TaxID=1348245 RepID=UPI0006299A2E|nr:hypothetical protein [Kordia jejudonensis]
MNTFHLAIKVKNIESTYQFYHKILGCKKGRSTERWIDFDFFGHQLSAHVSQAIPPLDYCGLVDEVAVPIPHFGCILSGEEFEQVAANLTANNIEFIVKPQIRFSGKASEQKTMFVTDFSDNALEFKMFKNPEYIFS